MTSWQMPRLDRSKKFYSFTYHTQFITFINFWITTSWQECIRLFLWISKKSRLVGDCRETLNFYVSLFNWSPTLHFWNIADAAYMFIAIQSINQVYWHTLWSTLVWKFHTQMSCRLHSSSVLDRPHFKQPALPWQWLLMAKAYPVKIHAIEKQCCTLFSNKNKLCIAF